MKTFALNLEKAEEACPVHGILAARCWLLYTGPISNYLAIIIIIDRNKNKLMTNRYVPT